MVDTLFFKLQLLGFLLRSIVMIVVITPIVFAFHTLGMHLHNFDIQENILRPLLDEGNQLLQEAEERKGKK